MLTKLAVSIVVLGALAAAPAAAGDGPGPFAQQGWPGVLVPPVDKSGPLRIVAVPASGGANTVLEQIQTKGGVVRVSLDTGGAYGIPSLVYGADGDSLSQHGRTLVLGNVGIGAT